ncbi:MAG: BamA/TamA family outer membrane protein [Muribaculaceae bacterium]|nr:BamA/TamA family outer membrane protein [Muribaculaceae bacterium]
MKQSAPSILSPLYIFIMMISLIISSCSTTRRLDPGEQLYTGVKKINIIPDSVGAKVPSGVSSAIKDAVDVPPNNYWSLVGWRYPFPLGLWVYNNWPRAEKGFKHWIYEKLVEDPVLISDVKPELRTHMIKDILNNNGYFSGQASYQLIPGKNPRKASVVYNITTGPSYTLRSIEFPHDSTRLGHMIDSIAQRQKYLTPGSRYCVDSLAAVRVNVTNSLRNKGYYYFRPEYLEYLADTVSNPGEVNIRMETASNIPHDLIVPYTTGKVTVIVRRNGRGGTPDTIQLPRATLIQMQPSRLRHSVITENVTLRPGKIFSVRDMDRTQNRLSRLGIFNSISIEPIPDTLSHNQHHNSDHDSEHGHHFHHHVLDVTVDCTLDIPLEASIEVNASSKSNSYIGPGITLAVTNHNIFGGGEQLAVKLTGAYEWQTGGDNSGGIFNSYEIGLTGSLAFPRLLAPSFIPRRKRDLNWTRFSLNGDLLNRPHFFKMAQVNMAMAYEWQATRHTSMSLTPLKLTYTKLMHTTADFDSIMAVNPAVAESFKSQFIPQLMFSYNYDRTFDPDNRLNWSTTVQEAGNVFWGIYQLCGKHGEKKLFGTPFSQFVKGQTQLVYNRRLGRGDHWLVMRGAVGAAHAYGNSSQVPYAEQFYCGGANSVRAFTVRSLGPGSYRAPEGTPGDYFDQTGTFKFEANIEYRFPLFGPLHGAIFLDSGNVWLLKEDRMRPGGKLVASKFLNQLALGTGAGLRLDISMLVVRVDLGVGIHAPYDTGKSGYYNMPSFKKSLALHLAIGYPF